MTEVSVIIPTFNRRTILEKTISDLCNQTFPKDLFELIIVDDFSTDDTREFLAALRLPIDFRYFLNDVNLGRAKTRNRGIEEAKGEYVLLIDDDIWASESLIEEHYKSHLRENQEVVVVGSILVAAGIPKTAVNERYNDHHLWCYREMNKYGSLLPYNFCKTANLSLPRKLFKKVGLFDEAFLYYGGEDTEFGYRLLKNDIKLIFNREAVGYHYHNETVESLITKEIERGKSCLTYKKLHPDYVTSTKTFFTPLYHKEFNRRAISYNLIKFFLFMPITRYINGFLIRSLDKTVVLRSLFVKYLIPILQLQYYRYGIKKAVK
jgi:glycosyltransferase involved in cell wall biosynthesis